MSNKYAIIVGLSLLTTIALGDGSQPKQNTLWVFGPFGLEHKMGGGGGKDTTLGIYLSGVIKDSDSGSEVKLGPTLEYMMYSAPNASGLGYGARVISADGISLAPSFAYVTRPSGNGVAFRLGASFPFGSDAIPFNFELGIGFRF